MQTTKFSGVITPLLTPFEDDGCLATDLYLAHARRMREAGSDYLSPFGTTGEALSLTLLERRALLEQLVASGTVAPDCLMPGTELCALDETVELTRQAVALGCAAVMVLPPFFYSEGDDGLVGYFEALIDKVASDRCASASTTSRRTPVSASLRASPPV